ncbi:hypothetical protein CANCADRAFT_142703 [Tortispora caseinolytica NRRL Y-17796]|uniref:Uncharacterized protein n=1 Tax=Tortispora caseinolytica NRRL Y-17796 TaxID=767744 RepID=A0A1E4TDC4_9ASCO|nr:hypothetical protein CANCADRAFT_142703 [Tortispora caseinolytica NRRL Y-17796]
MGMSVRYITRNVRSIADLDSGTAPSLLLIGLEALHTALPLLAKSRIPHAVVDQAGRGISALYGPLKYTSTPLDKGNRSAWTASTDKLDLAIGANTPLRVSIPASNTLFATNGEHQSLIFDANGIQVNGMRVEIDADVESIALRAPLTPLVEDLRIDEVASNMVKKISGKPASYWLETAVAERTTPLESDVYMVVHSQQSALHGPLRLKVIAGGGGWGAKAGLLVVDPDYSHILKKGDQVSFAVAGENVRQENTKMAGFLFECLKSQESFHTDRRTALVSPDLFHAASESTIIAGEQKLDMPGDEVSIRLRYE